MFFCRGAQRLGHWCCQISSFGSRLVCKSLSLLQCVEYMTALKPTQSLTSTCRLSVPISCVHQTGNWNTWAVLQSDGGRKKQRPTSTNISQPAALGWGRLAGVMYPEMPRPLGAAAKHGLSWDSSAVRPENSDARSASRAEVSPLLGERKP